MAVKEFSVYCQCNRCGDNFTVDATERYGKIRLDYHNHVIANTGAPPKHNCGGSLTLFRNKRIESLSS